MGKIFTVKEEQKQGHRETFWSQNDGVLLRLHGAIEPREKFTVILPNNKMKTLVMDICYSSSPVRL